MATFGSLPSSLNERSPLLQRLQNSEDGAGVDDEDEDDEDDASTASDSSFDPLLAPERRLSHINSHQTPGVAPEAGYTQFTVRHAGSRKSLRSATAPSSERGPISEPPEEAGDSPYMYVGKTRFWFIFTQILLLYFVACFDSTLMASSHPVITSYFNASNAASWLSTVFLLTSTAFQPLFGRISDTFGRRPCFIFGLCAFAATTAWCALAQSIESFICARAVAGIGAGGTMTMGMIICSDLIRLEDRGTYQSHINVFFGIGAASGAAFGGLLCDQLGWRWAFGIQVPFILVMLVGVTLSVPMGIGPELAKTEGTSFLQTMKTFDVAGSALLTSSVTLLILGLNLGGNIYPWKHPLVITALVLFAVFAALLLHVERRAKRPIMPLGLLSTTPNANLIFSNFFGSTATNVVLFNAPLFFQAVMQYSATDSGLELAVPSIIASACGVATGHIITYTRRMKPMLVLGAVCYLAGSICMVFIWQGIPNWASLLFISPVTAGQGFAFPATFIAALASNGQAEQAVVSTTLSLWRQLGTVMGVSVSSLVFQNALNVELQKTVTGPNKQSVILEVRKSVERIRTLDRMHKLQVMDAYTAALRGTFVLAVISSALMVLLVLPVQIVRLPKRKLRAGHDDAD